MTATSGCVYNSDPLKLVREGTSQEQRFPPALAPAYAPVNERKPEHAIVFAQAYAEFLRYYDASDSAVGDWRRFFGEDVAAQLAVAAVQDVDYYQFNVKASFDYLNNREHALQKAELKKHLGYLFSYAGTLAKQLDGLKNGLPDEIALKDVLQNLIKNQLAPAFERLIAYYQADLDLAPTHSSIHPLIADEQPDMAILGSATVAFKEIYSNGLSKDWIRHNAADWDAYLNATSADAAVYGSGTTLFERINHIATHSLFTAIFEQFLKVYARTVHEAKQALDAVFRWDGHEPHYALFLAFLRLFEYVRSETNTLTQRHLDFYYREILRLKERAAEPGRVHLLVELAKYAKAHEFKAGELFKAGKDERGNEAFFANDRDFVANPAQVASLKTLYRHKNTPNETLPFAEGRLFASPLADSGDGLGAALTSADQSWHPFFNKIYANGKLTRIAMPQAAIGFAFASHYLWLAEGKREVTVDFSVSGYDGNIGEEWASEIICCFSGAEGWLIKSPGSFKATDAGTFRLSVALDGDEPAVVAYNRKNHGFEFNTATPVLLVKITHNAGSDYIFPLFENVKLQQIRLQVSVDKVKNLSLSNDFGPIDASKPFFPFGAQPEAGSALLLGSKEIFLKQQLAYCDLTFRWKNKPSLASVAYLSAEQYFPSPQWDAYKNLVPPVNVAWLQEGEWQGTGSQTLFTSGNATVIDIKPPLDAFNKQDLPDFRLDAPYSLHVKSGYVKLALAWGLGHKRYRDALAGYFIALANKDTSAVKPVEPYTPEIESLSVKYSAVQTIRFDFADKAQFDRRTALFYHLHAFGHAEQHPYLKAAAADPSVYLLPPLSHVHNAGELPTRHEAEFYIGVAGLSPPQNLALLFQVADGTADPLAQHPPIHWSYLRNNEWQSFAPNAVEDRSDGLLNSGIITFAMPRDATADNTLLPSGRHWLRAAVASDSAAVCRLLKVAAQALQATFKDHGNDPAFAAKVLPAETIAKLDRPDAGVKQILQPFPSFGGRGAEKPEDFYRRVSERLRHKDRGIALWDYERLILEAFPQIFKVKCLNHTQYEPSDNGMGIYRELAPGHVTIVAVPNQQWHNLRDPLRPYTSLGLLREIESFMRKRLSCFVQLHVKNPQFEEVRVAFNVRFRDGYDITFYLGKLQEAVIRFLSPWAFPGGGSPTFGGKIRQSVLINFVEDQPYVDYAAEFNLSHSYLSPDQQGVEQPVTASGLTQIEGSKAVSILVSAPQHAINPITAAAETAPHETCPCEQ